MSRRRRILIGTGLILAVLVTLNTISVANQTEQAEVTVEGAEIMELTGGNLQVLDQPATGPEAGRGIPLVMIHCYGCSLKWWDGIVPALNERHRIVRVDLLGHGGSEKPAQGFEIDAQADLIAEAIGSLGIEGAMVIGHSLGASVAGALAQRNSELVDRVGVIGFGPDSSFGDLGLLSEISRWPVVGEMSWRLTPRFIQRSVQESKSFAPGFDVATGFENDDQQVEDLRAMNYTAFERWPDAVDEWNGALGLSRRLASANVPVLVVLGSDDQVIRTDDAAAAFRETLPIARVVAMDGVGHSPQVEAPDETAMLIEDFAAEAEVAPAKVGPDSAKPQPGPQKKKRKNRQDKKR